ARLDLDERAVVGDVGHLAEHAGVGRVAARDVVPRILAQLLQAQAPAVALAVVLEHADFQLLADLDHLGGMAHALPRHVGDVQQAVDAAQVHERAVVGEVLDHALELGALDQLLHQRLALLGVLALDHRAARDHHVVALAVELDELELELLPSRYTGSRTGRTSTSEPGRNARTSLMSTVKPPLTLPLMRPVTVSSFSRASSSSSHTMARLAFSRDSTVSPKPFSSESRA